MLMFNMRLDRLISYISASLKPFMSYITQGHKIWKQFPHHVEPTSVDMGGKTNMKRLELDVCRSQSTFYAPWSACDPLKILIFHVPLLLGRFFVLFQTTVEHRAAKSIAKIFPFSFFSSLFIFFSGNTWKQLDELERRRVRCKKKSAVLLYD